MGALGKFARPSDRRGENLARICAQMPVARLGQMLGYGDCPPTDDLEFIFECSSEAFLWRQLSGRTNEFIMRLASPNEPAANEGRFLERLTEDA